MQGGHQLDRVYFDSVRSATRPKWGKTRNEVGVTYTALELTDAGKRGMLLLFF